MANATRYEGRSGNLTIARHVRADAWQILGNVLPLP